MAEHPGSLRPIFGFRIVFKSLPKLAGHDDITEKRLILGLHEWLWHAPYMDIKNVLLRCGMPGPMKFGDSLPMQSQHAESVGSLQEAAEDPSTRAPT